MGPKSKGLLVGILAGVAILAVIFVLALPKRSDIRFPANALPMQTPKDMLRTYAKAIREGDPGTILYYGRVEAKWRDAVAQQVRGMHAAWRLKQALLKTHGPDGWTKFLKACDGMVLVVIPDEADWAKELVEVAPSSADRDQAEFRFSESGGSVELLRINGAWYWDSRQGRGAFSPHEFEMMYETIEKSVNRACDLAQQPNSRLEDIARIIKDMLR